MQRQDCVDQTLTVLSSPADTNSFPLAPKRMALMLFLWSGAQSESSVKEAAEPLLWVYQHNVTELKWERWSWEGLLTGGRRPGGAGPLRRRRRIGRGERRLRPERLGCRSWIRIPCYCWCCDSEKLTSVLGFGASPFQILGFLSIWFLFGPLGPPRNIKLLTH